MALYIMFVDDDECFEHVVEVTEDEWQQLIKPAVAKKLSIDGSTVDEQMRDMLLDRKASRVSRQKINHYILMV